MESAKAAIQEHLSRDGKHDTSVHETFNPAVTNEKVHDHHKHHHTTAVDREEHVDHYHTTVQPVHDTQVLPETHHHQAAPVEHRKFEHGDDDEVQRRLQAEQAKFVDTTDKGETHHTHENAPVVGGVHTHHHIHESIQPVVQRQTIEPHVHHNVIPVHEHHHLAAQHHASSALPALSMDEFKKQGGALGGREQRSDFFEGEPQNYAKDSSNAAVENPSHEFRQTGHHDLHGNTNQDFTGTNASTTDGLGGTTGTDGATNSSGTSGTKASLLDRLNPKKDADGDGKRGIFS